MLTTYMFLWSIFMIAAIGIWRMRRWTHLLVVTLCTFLILVLSQSVFFQLSQVAGANPALVLTVPEHYFGRGPAAWLALFVMPCGWLGPFLGLRLVEKCTMPVELSA